MLKKQRIERERQALLNAELIAEEPVNQTILELKGQLLRKSQEVVVASEKIEKLTRSLGIMQKAKEEARWNVEQREKELKRGIWQYLMDHSKPNHAGHHYIQFTIKDKTNFWGRVQARVDGKYSVIKVEREEELALHLQSRAKENGFADRLDVIEFEIRESGKWWDRLLLSVYKRVRAYLYNRK